MINNIDGAMYEISFDKESGLFFLLFKNDKYKGCRVGLTPEQFDTFICCLEEARKENRNADTN